MPVAKVRGADINYEVLGTRGPWVALSPGGRRAMGAVRDIARMVAEAGYRVLIHDRRNCGESDILVDSDEGENEIWADDLHELLSQLGALPACIGGGSSGSRLSIVFALRHPAAVSSLLLWRITGGAHAANHLAQSYYGQYADAAEQGGMAAVCETEHFRERIETRSEIGSRLLAMNADRFIAVMRRWQAQFAREAANPVLGATESQLRSITAPAFVIPGNDVIHRREAARAAHRLMPNNEMRELMPEGPDLDVIPFEEWQKKEGEMAALLVDFLRRANSGTPAAGTAQQ